MIQSLKNRLVILYTGTTGLILTLVIIIILINSNQKTLNGIRLAFQNSFWTINNSIITNNAVNDIWMAEMEIENKLIIRVEDNNVPLFFKGTAQGVTSSGLLVERLKAMALKDNIDTTVGPISNTEIQSPIYRIEGDFNDFYLGQIYIARMKSTKRCVIILQNITKEKDDMIKRYAFYVGLDIIGIIFFYLISVWIIGKSLLPVEESKRRQTQFIAAASHELKSPLAVIRVNASAIRLEPDRAEHYVKIIDKECERAGKLIEDMLFLANTNTKNWEVKMEAVDIEAVLFDVYDTFLPLCMENGKKLTLDLQEEILPKVQGDSYRIKQIFAILIDNAVTYSTEGDTILLRTYVKKNSLWFEVEDHGEGIEPSKKEEIFECFYREDRAHKDRNHYGLGLNIAKELVSLHLGSIFVRDTPGGGATFCIVLPIKQR